MVLAAGLGLDAMVLPTGDIRDPKLTGSGERYPGSLMEFWDVKLWKL